MKVLISGFEAFASLELNPSTLLVEAVKRGEVQLPPGMQIEALCLPVTFELAFAELYQAIKKFSPDVVLAFGLARGRSGAIELERVAINCLDADIPDNAGMMPRDLKINDRGAPAYFSTLPIRKMEIALKHAGIPAKISNTAGTYVCNFLFYRLMESCLGTEIKAGFIHVPLLPEQAKLGEPSLALSELVEGVSWMLKSVR